MPHTRRASSRSHPREASPSRAGAQGASTATSRGSKAVSQAAVSRASRRRAIARTPRRSITAASKPLRGPPTSTPAHRSALLTTPSVAAPGNIPGVTHAVVLIQAERSALPTLGGELAEIEGVAEAYSVTGEWDFVAILRVGDPETLASVVTQRLAGLAGIARTYTMVAFEAYSQHDLEAMFSIGA